MTDLGEHFARVSITASNCAQKWERSHPTRVEIKGKDFLGLWNGSVWPQARQLKQILDRFCCRKHQRELLMHWQHHPTCVTENQHETPKYFRISITWSRLKSLRINRFWTTRFCKLTQISFQHEEKQVGRTGAVFINFGFIYLFFISYFGLISPHAAGWWSRNL